MTTTFPTNSTFCGTTNNGFSSIPAPTGVPFNGFTPAPYAGTTTGFAQQTYPNSGFVNGYGTPIGYPTFFNSNGFNSNGFSAPGFNPAQFYPTNSQWPQFGQWPQFATNSFFGAWNNPGFRFNGPTGFNGFGYPAFNTTPAFNTAPAFSTAPAFNTTPWFNTWSPFNGVPSFNTWPSFNNVPSPSNWNNTPGFFPQGGFTPNFGGFTPGFTNAYPGFDSSVYANTYGGFPAWNWQQNFSTPFNTYAPTNSYPTPTPFAYAQNFGFGTPFFGAFPWASGTSQPFNGPVNFGGQFNYGPSSGTPTQPFIGQYAGQYSNGQYINGITPTGSPIPGTCNGIGLNREAA